MTPTTSETPDLRYPIGRYAPPEAITEQQVDGWIDEIADLPGDLRARVAPLTDDQLDTPYRAGGWTVRQVVHHLFDSHLNSYVRFKWTLTEDRPVIKAYDEKAWAELPDARGSVGPSLDALEALHARWEELLRRLSWSQFQLEFVHPKAGPVPLGRNVGLYAWHGRHHLAHIERLMEREGWMQAE